MADLVEGFREVHYEYIRLFAITHVDGDIVYEFYEPPEQCTFIYIVLKWSQNILKISTFPLKFNCCYPDR